MTPHVRGKALYKTSDHTTGGKEESPGSLSTTILSETKLRPSYHPPMPSDKDTTSSRDKAGAGDRAPLSAEPGVYRDDGKRQVPLSAEGGVYEHDVENEPKTGTAGEGGVSITNEGNKSKV